MAPYNFKVCTCQTSTCTAPWQLRCGAGGFTLVTIAVTLLPYIYCGMQTAEERGQARLGSAASSSSAAASPSIQVPTSRRDNSYEQCTHAGLTEHQPNIAHVEGDSGRTRTQLIILERNSCTHTKIQCVWFVNETANHVVYIATLHLRFSQPVCHGYDTVWIVCNVIRPDSWSHTGQEGLALEYCHPVIRQGHGAQGTNYRRHVKYRESSDFVEPCIYYVFIFCCFELIFFFPSFFLSLTSFYLLTISEESYCGIWSQSRTHTYVW